ncbi:glycosyltransferase [Spirosoma flavum]|uniref:Glycosyltransferase n=1 Tax=Spirosoma flavum TaxID=2048557 RepID=A0ABW6AJ74_9BACT
MHIVFFAHPSFLNHQSMPRFARVLAEGMKERGHKVELWSPQARFFRLPSLSVMRKWLGYIDQYIVFPREVRIRLKQCPPNTLFVLTDNALGPYVPFIADRPHVIHCHDFLAQRSALGEIRENPTSWTGRSYQAFIRRGYSKGKRFIYTSRKTQEDLHRFLPQPPLTSEVVYNYLNQSFVPSDVAGSRRLLGSRFGLDLAAGYLLHVGGNIWYKNRLGVIDIYDAWRSTDEVKLPLLLIGEVPDSNLIKRQELSPFKTDIHFFSGIEDEFVRLAYAGASVFIFPSLAEGFGWPIAEAMASGCPVITTDEAPMTEVAGKAGFLIPRRPHAPSKVDVWATEAAKVVKKVLRLSPAEYEEVIQSGLKNSERFDQKKTLDRIEQIYQKIVEAA